MKNIVTLILFLSGTMLFAQDKEWKALVDLLREETRYFEGKEGRFWRGITSTFTDFKLEKLEIESLDEFENMICMETSQYAYHLSLEAYVTTEILVFTPSLYPDIKSAQILYEYGGYFADYPKSLYLQIEMNEPYFYSTTLTEVKNTKTGKTEEFIQEEELDSIILPIRAENREKIFKAIDAYVIEAYSFKLFSI